MNEEEFKKRLDEMAPKQLVPGSVEDECCEPAPARDNWSGRKQRMRCKTCMWFALKKAVTFGKPLGRCRRLAPTMGGFPVVYMDDWCGDHKIDEEKV